MRANQKIGKKSGRKPVKVSRESTIASHPPPVVIQPAQKFILRTIANSSEQDEGFNYNTLAGMLGIIATSSTVSTYLSTSFKLRRIRMWGPVATAGTPVTVSLRATMTSADFVTPPKTWTDTSISYDHPAFVDWKPPRGSLAEKWHSSAQGDQIFTLTFPVGATIDFHFSYVLNDALGTINGPTLSGATVGLIYHKTEAGLTPVEVNTI